MKKRLFGLALLLAAPALLAQTVTDLAGRRVEVPAKVQRILIGEGRMLPSLAILERDKLDARLVGMMGDFELLDPAGYAQYRQRFPRLDQVTRMGKSGGDSFSVEQALALRPDVAIFGLHGHGPGVDDKATLSRLEKAGVKVVYVDFADDPLADTERSMTLLGAVLGRQKEAAEFTAFYRAEREKVAQRLKGVTRKPTVFIENRVGLSRGCCDTLNQVMLGRILQAAGGDNIAAPLVPGTHGTVNIEFLLKAQPDFYIGTAIGTPDSPKRGDGRIAMGAGVDEATARASLKQALTRTGVAQLKAVQERRAYAIWHHYGYSAQNIVALQAMAKWLHPERMRDIDPQDTLRRFHQRFLPIPQSGAYWVGLS